MFLSAAVIEHGRNPGDRPRNSSFSFRTVH